MVLCRSPFSSPYRRLPVSDSPTQPRLEVPSEYSLWMSPEYYFLFYIVKEPLKKNFLSRSKIFLYRVYLEYVSSDSLNVKVVTKTVSTFPLKKLLKKQLSSRIIFWNLLQDLVTTTLPVVKMCERYCLLRPRLVRSQRRMCPEYLSTTTPV